jgi:hypothetical protein
MLSKHAKHKGKLGHHLGFTKSWTAHRNQFFKTIPKQYAFLTQCKPQNYGNTTKNVT